MSVDLLSVDECLLWHWQCGRWPPVTPRNVSTVQRAKRELEALQKEIERRPVPVVAKGIAA